MWVQVPPWPGTWEATGEGAPTEAPHPAPGQYSSEGSIRTRFPALHCQWGKCCSLQCGGGGGHGGLFKGWGCLFPGPRSGKWVGTGHERLRGASRRVPNPRLALPARAYPAPPFTRLQALPQEGPLASAGRAVSALRACGRSLPGPASAAAGQDREARLASASELAGLGEGGPCPLWGRLPGQACERRSSLPGSRPGNRPAQPAAREGHLRAGRGRGSLTPPPLARTGAAGKPAPGGGATTAQPPREARGAQPGSRVQVPVPALGPTAPLGSLETRSRCERACPACGREGLAGLRAYDPGRLPSPPPSRARPPLLPPASSRPQAGRPRPTRGRCCAGTAGGAGPFALAPVPRRR